MASLTVSQCLGKLEQDPDDLSAFEALESALGSGDPERLGESPLRLIEAARAGHERRGEYGAVARLLELETDL
ncbi:MAG: hypothetical protein OEY14_13750, partial [Myxococcales bacterium]|nr:hypothetical protein [Myxococcales bacterium]